MTIEQVVVSTPEIAIVAGQPVKIPINVTDLTGLNVLSFELIAECDPNALAIDGLDSENTVAPGWMIAINNYVAPFSKSNVKLAAANAYPAVGGGVLVYLNCFAKVTGTIKLLLTECRLNETTLISAVPVVPEVPVIPVVPVVPEVPVIPVVPEVPPVVPSVPVEPPVSAPLTMEVCPVYVNMPGGTQKLWGYQLYSIVNNSIGGLLKQITLPANNKEDAEEWNALTGMNIPVPTNSRYSSF